MKGIWKNGENRSGAGEWHSCSDGAKEMVRLEKGFPMNENLPSHEQMELFNG
jgi:hypothetical protein